MVQIDRIVRPRVCHCCGEPISEKPNTFSRNPNLCAACEDLGGGFREPTEIEFAAHLQGSFAVDKASAKLQGAAQFYAKADSNR